jgi:hypothetical protein
VSQDATPAGLAASSIVGFIVGGLTAAGTYELYPPARDHVWPISVLAIGSVLAVVILYLLTVRLGVLRAGDSFVVGYGLALVLAASLVVSRELVHALREHVPENLGVKRVALSRVEVPG